MSDPVTVAEASLAYDSEKPESGHRVSYHTISRRFGIKPHDLANFRRGLSPRKTTKPVAALRKQNKSFLPIPPLPKE